MQPKRNDIKLQAAASRGFTLIEVMIVVLIIAILAAIEYPSYLESVRKTKRAEGRTALLQLMQQQERYYSQHGTYIEFSSTEPNGFQWFSGSSSAGSAYEITATACEDDTHQNCISLVAKPGTQKVNSGFKDDVCGELSLASTGIKAASGHGEQCW